MLKDTHIQTEAQAPSLTFQGQFLLLNGLSIPYQRQTLKTHSLFLTDLAIDLPMEEQIHQFDEKYFQFSVIKLLIKDLETLPPSASLQILEQLSPLSEKDYANLFLKLSLQKLKQLLMDNGLYLHLWHSLSELSQKSQQSKDWANRVALGQLDQPYKRGLNLLDTIDIPEGLREALTITVTEIIQSVLHENNFIPLLCDQPHTLGQDNRRIGKRFLSNIVAAFQTLHSISKCPQEIFEVRTHKKQVLSATLFRKQCMHLIAYNFDSLFHYDRDNLTEVLSLIAAENSSQLWTQIIAKKCPSPPSLSQQQNIFDSVSSKSADKFEVTLKTNEATFIMLLLSNFYQRQCNRSLLMLEAIVKHNAVDGESILIKTFLQILESQLSCPVIEVVLVFLRKVCHQNGQISKNVELFILEFMTIINCHIQHQFNQYQKKKTIMPMFKKFKAREHAIRINSVALMTFFRAYTTIIDLQLVPVLVDIDCTQPLQHLITMTELREGAIRGTLQTFLKRKDLFLLQRNLQNPTANKPQNISRFYAKEVNIQRFVKFLQTLQ